MGLDRNSSFFPGSPFSMPRCSIFVGGIAYRLVRVLFAGMAPGPS